MWLVQADLSLLFNKNKRTISEHIGNIFKEAELNKTAVVRDFRITASDNKPYQVKQYNLDVMISVGIEIATIWFYRIVRLTLNYLPKETHN